MAAWRSRASKPSPPIGSAAQCGWPRMAVVASIVILLAIGTVHVWRMLKASGLEAPTVKQWNDNQLIETFGLAVLASTIMVNMLGQMRLKKGRRSLAKA